MAALVLIYTGPGDYDKALIYHDVGGSVRLCYLHTHWPRGVLTAPFIKTGGKNVANYRPVCPGRSGWQMRSLSPRNRLTTNQKKSHVVKA